MWSGASIAGKGSAPFRVSNTGALVATNANITGAITATSGNFAGTVRGGDIYIGGTNTSNAPFKVDTNGNLTATSADITGVIRASSGNIAGININAGKLYAGAGNWANADTGFYLDLNGYFSLKNKFYWDPTALSGAGQATFAGALSGASGSVTNNFSIGTGCIIGGSLSVGDNVRINNATADGAATVFKVRGNGTSTSKWIAKFQNNNPTDILSIRDDGLITMSGNLDVDNTITVTSGSNTNAIQVNRNYSATANFIQFVNSSSGNAIGAVEFNGTANVNYKTSSDQRLKENILEIQDACLTVKNMNPVEFNFITDGPELKMHGFLAQELYETYPYPVSVGSDDIQKNAWGIDYSKMTPILTAAIKELIDKIEKLESQVATLGSN